MNEACLVDIGSDVVQDHLLVSKAEEQDRAEAVGNCRFSSALEEHHKQEDFWRTETEKPGAELAYEVDSDKIAVTALVSEGCFVSKMGVVVFAFDLVSTAEVTR